MVSGSRQRRDDYYHKPRYTRHPADRQEWSRRRRATDRQAAARRRGAIVISACDSRAEGADREGLEGAAGGQLREHNEEAPALRRSFFQAGHAGSIPVTRSHRDVQVTPHSAGDDEFDGWPASPAVGWGASALRDSPRSWIRTTDLALGDQRGSHAVVAHARHQVAQGSPDMAANVNVFDPQIRKLAACPADSFAAFARHRCDRRSGHADQLCRTIDRVVVARTREGRTGPTCTSSPNNRWGAASAVRPGRLEFAES